MRREKVNLNIRLRADLTTMEINIVTGHRPIAGVVLSAAELDGVMAGLADIRSKMTPEIPQKFPHGQPIHNHEATNYLFGIDPFSGIPSLSFRSPGFGWLTFAIPEAEIERIYRALQESKNRPIAQRSDKQH
jgi:hypothetical protein